jgi:hypothetical protein
MATAQIPDSTAQISRMCPALDLIFRTLLRLAEIVAVAVAGSTVELRSGSVAFSSARLSFSGTLLRPVTKSQPTME